MKRIAILLLLTIGLTGLCQAQPLGVNLLYAKYRGQEGVVSVYVPGFAMKLVALIADLDVEERELLRSVRSVKVLTIEDHDRYPNVNFARELRFRSGDDGYIPMLEVIENGEEIRILAQEKRGKLKGLLVVVGGEENVLVHIKGRMDADLISSLAGITDIDELRYTRRL